MPYRGTNAKRQVVHAKSKNTLRDGAKNHYHDEKKEIEHELSQNRTSIQKLLNDGYRYHCSNVEENKTLVIFKHNTLEDAVLEFNYAANYNLTKELFNS